MVRRIRDKLRKHFEQVLELKDSPSSIAMGFAIGTFIAIFPTFGLGIFIGLIFIAIFKNISKVSMLVSFAIWNPFVLAFLFPLEYGLGDFILSGLSLTKFKFAILNQIFVYTARYLLGNLIFSVVISSVCYIFVLCAVTKFQGKKLRSLKKEIVLAEKTLEI